MIKRIVVSAIFMVSAACAFADWSRIISAGISVPFQNTTFDWEEDYGTEHETGYGIGLDGQFRTVKDNGLSLMCDIDAGYANIGDIEGARSGLFIGAGYNFSKNESYKIIFSGVAGAEQITLSDSDSFVWNGHDIDDDTDFTDLIIGADLYLSKQVSDSFGFFAQCTVGLGIGVAEKKFSFEKGDSTFSRSFEGTGDIFIVKPKAGVCWTF